jgi:hypothetical protein
MVTLAIIPMAASAHPSAQSKYLGLCPGSCAFSDHEVRMSLCFSFNIGAYNAFRLAKGHNAASPLADARSYPRATYVFMDTIVADNQTR